MEKAKEILEKMKDKRSWKESEVSMDEVRGVLEEITEGKTDNDNSNEIKRMKSKIDRLTESNKQLMSENKRLKGAK